MKARLIDADRAVLLAAHDRLLSRAVRDEETGCLLAGHARNGSGYSTIGVAGRMEYAHRVAWAVHTGETLADLRDEYARDWLQLDHDYDAGCRNRHCFEITHLRKVTARENTVAYKERIVACPRGHTLDGENLSPAHLRSGWRKCRTCHRARARVSDARRRGKHLDLGDAIDAVLAKYPDMAAAALGDPVDVPTSAPTISTRLQALAA